MRTLGTAIGVAARLEVVRRTGMSPMIVPPPDHPDAVSDEAFCGLFDSFLIAMRLSRGRGDVPWA